MGNFFWGAGWMGEKNLKSGGAVIVGQVCNPIHSDCTSNPCKMSIPAIDESLYDTLNLANPAETAMQQPAVRAAYDSAISKLEANRHTLQELRSGLLAVLKEPVKYNGALFQFMSAAFQQAMEKEEHYMKELVYAFLALDENAVLSPEERSAKLMGIVQHL